MPQLIPGNYKGKIVSAITSQAKSGNNQVEIEFDIVAGKDGGQWSPIDGERRRVFLSLSEKARAYSEDKLESIGFKGDYAAIKFDDALVADGVELVCRHEEYNGSTREKWDFASWGAPREVAAAPADEIKRLNALYAQRMKSKIPF